jgi:transposase
MIYAALDIHKHVIQAAVLDSDTGEVEQERFAADRVHVAAWAERHAARVAATAIEATNGWRWVCRELQAAGLEVRLCDPGQAVALKGKRRRAKNDRLDARWMAVLLAKQMLPESWLAPEDIQRLRDQTRLREALRHDKTRWAERLHAVLAHEGFACLRAKLLTRHGREWLTALELEPHVRAQVNVHLRMLSAIEDELAELEIGLRAMAGSDRRALALQTIYGVGPIIACYLLAEIGDARRFRRARQIVRLAGLDPVVADSAEQRRRGKLSKQGSPHLRWALVQAAQQTARRPHSPDRDLYLSARERCGAQRANLTCARKIARRAYHVLATLDPAA